MRKHIIISVLIDLSLGLLMAAGLIPTVWWIVFVAVIIQLVITVIIDRRKKNPWKVTDITRDYKKSVETEPQPGCRHLFDANRVVDLNDDPPCVVCGKYFSLITMQEWVKVTPVTDQDTWVTLEPRDKLYKTVPRNVGQRQQPTV